MRARSLFALSLLTFIARPIAAQESTGSPSAPAAPPVDAPAGPASPAPAEAPAAPAADVPVATPEAPAPVDAPIATPPSGTDLAPLGGDIGGDIGAIEGLALEDLLGSVSAVSRRKESVLKAPATVTVVGRSDIDLSAAENVPELLRSVPGIQVVRVGPGNYLVSVRGLGGVQANNLVVLIDGIPVNNRADGTVDWNALPVHLNEIDRIEVVRGPVGAIWGTNAITGVINIVTRTTTDAGPLPLAAKVEAAR